MTQPTQPARPPRDPAIHKAKTVRNAFHLLTWEERQQITVEVLERAYKPSMIEMGVRRAGKLLAFRVLEKYRTP